MITWLVHVGLVHVGLVQVGLVHVGLVQVGLVHVGLVHVGLVHVGLVQVGLVHVGLVHVRTRPRRVQQVVAEGRVSSADVNDEDERKRIRHAVHRRLAALLQHLQ